MPTYRRIVCRDRSRASGRGLFLPYNSAISAATSRPLYGFGRRVTNSMPQLMCSSVMTLGKGAVLAFTRPAERPY